LVRLQATEAVFPAARDSELAEKVATFVALFMEAVIAEKAVAVPPAPGVATVLV
jgi:hypothetical protein